jgi:hypothetical protein
LFNETSYNRNHGLRSFSTGLGALGDYVHQGDTLYWAGNVAGLAQGGGTWIPGFYSGNKSWSDTFNGFLSLLSGEGFQIVKSENNESAKSIAVNVVAPVDFSNIGDVNGLISGIAGQAGFQLQATNIQPGARNLATPQPSPWVNPIGTAAGFWGDEIGKGAQTFWDSLSGASQGGGGMNLLVIGGLALAALFILKK